MHANNSYNPLIRFTFIAVIIFIINSNILNVQQMLPDDREPMGIALENYQYPFPVQYLEFSVEGEDVRMAYMDVSPDNPNGKTVVLMHGKNFFGAYWGQTIKTLAAEGYRVIVPDQIGFGKSSKPIIRYSFHSMGAHTNQLLDALDTGLVAVVGHSMGGMLAARYSLMYPERVSHLVLVNPIGLEDYRIKTSWVPVDSIYQGVLRNTEDQIRSYHENYYVEWKEQYEKYVQVHYRWTLSGDYPRFAMVSAITSQMIYEQPVIHEFQNIKPETLLVIGQEDRTAPGRDRAAPEIAMGQYPELGSRAAEAIPNASLVEMDNIGHAPHLEASEEFFKVIMPFLE